MSLNSILYLRRFATSLQLCLDLCITILLIQFWHSTSVNGSLFYLTELRFYGYCYFCFYKQDFSITQFVPCPNDLFTVHGCNFSRQSSAIYLHWSEHHLLWVDQYQTFFYDLTWLTALIVNIGMAVISKMIFYYSWKFFHVVSMSVVHSRNFFFFHDN